MIKKIIKANKSRKFSTIPRRMIKLMEEIGEMSEAYLAMTSTNAKKKKWEDLREEMIDMCIVAIDITFTPFPHEKKVSKKKLEKLVDQKLLKWKKSKNNTKTN